MIGFLEVAPGEKSMGRLLAATMVYGGIGCAIAALVISSILAFLDKDYGAFVGIVVGSLAEAGGGGFIKAWQKRTEAKTAVVLNGVAEKP